MSAGHEHGHGGRTGDRRRLAIVLALTATVLGVLLAVGGYIAVEAIVRLAEPPEIASSAVLVFGAIGLAVNAIGIVVLSRGGRSSGNVNMRAALLAAAPLGTHPRTREVVGRTTRCT